jgi:hypothetical protein
MGARTCATRPVEVYSREGRWTIRLTVCWLCVGLAFATTQSACGKAAHTAKASTHHDPAVVGTEPPQSQRVVIAPAATHQVIVKVGHRTITRGYLEQWTPLEVLFASRYKDSSTVPMGLVPDPPSYRNCIAYLAATSSSTQEAGKPSQTQLRGRCEHEHETQVLFTLSHLIKYSWVYEEAAKMGVKAGPADVRRLIAASGVKPAVLEALGVPPSYQGFVAGAEALDAKIFTVLPLYRRKLREQREGHRETLQVAMAIDRQFERYYSGLLSRWAPKTHCAPEYIVWGCSEYSAEATSPL